LILIKSLFEYVGPPRFYRPQPVLASKGSEVMLKCQLEKDSEPIVKLINNFDFSKILK